jgi:hypothetical protein
MYLLDSNHVPFAIDTSNMAAVMAAYTRLESQRRVRYTKVGNVAVSTVFLGIDHNFRREGPPVLFETMVFGVPSARYEYQDRYCTYDEAVAGHTAVLAKVMGPRLIGNFMRKQKRNKNKVTK